MCGIAGSLRSDWDVDAALDTIAHRGPDGRHVFREADVVHGHVRLAIMDPLPRSDCPFVTGEIALSYVGECWNFRELRAELEKAGFAFYTEGDTEVVAAALAFWTPQEALRRMEGQFAFVWTDRRWGKTYAARDRFGEVPLYVLDQGDGDLFSSGGIAWASERKAFAERGAEAVPVPAGSTWELGKAPVPYYEIITRRNGYAGDPAECLDIVERSVRRRLQSDVPVCCLISGGVDSSTILALTKRVMPDVVAYTIVFDEKAADLEEARFIADHLGVELREVPVPPPTPVDLREAIRSIEITMKAQIEIAVHCLPLAERIYADGFRVVLSGEGADELFGGYGMLARHAKTNWVGVRAKALDKMSRGNFVRINKAFMAHGVEARTPYMDRELVEAVLPLTREECPEQKKLLRAAVSGLLPERTYTRHKVAFQTGSGMREFCEGLLEGEQQIRYNSMARDLFGGLPRG